MKNPRNIKFIVIHCTETPQDTSIESIKKYWKEHRGWGDTPGYHYIIKKDGTVVQLLDESKNSNSLHTHENECINIAYIGGIDKTGKPIDNRTRSQETAMFDLIISLMEKYPRAEALGYRDFAGVIKACPSFDVKTWLREYTPDLNIAA